MGNPQPWRWLVPVSLTLVLAGCAGGGGGGATAGPTHAPEGDVGPPCILADSDAALDDFRAIGALARSTRLVGVIATEGVSSPAGGAMALSHLLTGAGLPSPVTVLVGEASPAPAQESWISEARANAERLNGFLTVSVPVASTSRALADEVERLTRDCGQVRVLVIGPWTSFVRYQARFGARLRLVVAQGVPLEDVPAGRSPGFNCRYDLAACRQAHETLRPAKLGVWVDVPRNVTPAYAPTTEMIQALAPAGLPGTLRALMLGNPGAWIKDTLMWDDSAALFLLHPEAFGPKGSHMEPQVPPDEIRRLWLAVANRAS